MLQKKYTEKWLVSLVTTISNSIFSNCYFTKKKCIKTKNVYGRWIWLDCIIFRAFAEKSQLIVNKWVLNNTYRYTVTIFFFVKGLLFYSHLKLVTRLVGNSITKIMAPKC